MLPQPDQSIHLSYLIFSLGWAIIQGTVLSIVFCVMQPLSQWISAKFWRWVFGKKVTPVVDPAAKVIPEAK